MKPPALFLFNDDMWDNVFGPEERARLEALLPTPLRFRTDKTIYDHPEELAEAEFIFGSWGIPPCDQAFLDAAPNLKAIFYAAGSVRPFVTDALWRRGIVISSANAALSITVAEYTLGQILLSLKSMWSQAAETRLKHQLIRRPFPGLYGSVVGLISVGAVARHLLKLLCHFHLRVVAYDPFLTDAMATELGIEKASLENLFEISDVVSLHTPHLPETEGMIRSHHFSRMKPGATFINTARGAVVNEPEMIAALTRRSDLYALLDVTYPEPPDRNSPLHQLPNVILTPHIAGALGNECRRLGSMAIDEFEQYRAGQPLQGQVREEMMRTIA